MRRSGLWFAPLIALLSLASARAAEPTVAAQSDALVWNGVVRTGDRLFVSGPHWAGSVGPSVALVTGKDRFEPFPDAQWNERQPGQDPARVFVNVNAIHLDGRNTLWVVDTGVPTFGKGPLPEAAKLVQIDPATAQVLRVLHYPAGVLRETSYTDDIRFHGDFAFVTDAGSPGVIVIDLRSGAMRRVLSDSPATTATPGRSIVVAGQVLNGPDGKPLAVNTDPMEVSPDGKWYYFGPLEGPWSRIETRLLEDFSVPLSTLASSVQPWVDLPPTGGTVMDRNGDLYFSDLANDAVKRRAADGSVTEIARGDRFHWVDAMFIDEQHTLWMPVPQLDRAAIFHGGTSAIRRPVQLFSLPLPSDDRQEVPEKPSPGERRGTADKPAKP